MAKQQDVIKAFMSSLCNTNLSGLDALDEAVRACSSFSSAQDVRNQMINNDLNYCGSDTFLSNYCGINLGNRDDGAITGSDAGNGIEKTRESVIPENGNLDTGFTSDSFTVKGLTFQLNGTTFYNLDDDKKFIWQCLKTWWAEGALNLIEESYGSYFNFNGMLMLVSFESAATFASWGSSVAGAASTGSTDGNCHLYINQDRYKKMNFSDYNGTSAITTNELDRLIAHEFTHAIMTAKGSAAGLPQFITEGLAELTRGIDHQYKTTIESLVRNSSTLLENLSFDPGTADWASYAAGYIFLRYLAKQGATNYQAPALFDNEDNNQQNNTSGKVLNAFAGNDTVGNWGNNVTLNTGSGNDSVFNDQQGHSSVIDTGEGDDTIWSWGANSTLNAGSGNDSITNHVLNITMDGGSGNDTLINWNDAMEVKMSGGDGEDYLQNHGYNVTIEGGAGNDSVYNEGNGAFINTGGGNDTVRNWEGTYLRIELGDGNDTVENCIGHNASINAGDGADYINNSTSNYASIYAGYGNDFVWNWEGTNAKIELGAGNDSITNWYGSSSTIAGGSGADFIHNNAANYSSIDAGADNDTIRNESSERVTISGGSGDDLVSIDGSSSYTMIKYSQGDGYDTIYGYNSGDTISLGGGYYTRETVGSNIVVSLLSGGAMTLVDVSNKNVNITGGTLSVAAIFTEGDDYYSNNTPDTVLSALSGYDTIFNSAQYVTINAGDGNDSVNSNNGAYSNAYVTINAGAGNDTIVGRYGDSSISGGAGDDKISMSGDVDRATILGGTGNDIIYLDGYLGGDGRNMIQYSSGDGLDTVYGISANDTLKITGSSYAKATVGNDLKISVGSGSILLKDALDISFTIDGTLTSNNTISNTFISGTGGNDSIHLGTANYVTVYASEGADTVTGNYYNSQIYGGTGSDSLSIVDENFYSWSNSYALLTSKYLKLTNSWEENLSNTIDGGAGDDTINIIGFSSSYINGGAGNDRISHSGETGFLPGRTIKGGTGNDIIYGIGDISLVGEAQGYHGFSKSGTHYEYSYGDGNDTIFNYHSTDTISIVGNSPYTTLTNGNHIAVSVIGSGSITLYNAKDTKLNIEGGTPTVPSTFTENADYYSNSTSNTVLNALSGNDTIVNSATRVTINGAAGADKIISTNSSVSANGGDGNDYLEIEGYYNTIFGGDGNDSIYNSGRSTKIYGGGGADRIVNSSGLYVTINGGNDNDTIENYSNYHVINGDAGDDAIYNYNGNGLEINGGDGNDYVYIYGYDSTISGGSGNDSISLGKHGNIIRYASGDGNDFIYGYNLNDTISIVGSSYYTTLTSGNDVIISLSGGAMTLDGASGRELNIGGGKYTVSSAGLEVENFANNTLITGTAENDTIESRASRVTIRGGDGGDFISSNGTLQGGNSGSYSEVLYNNIIDAGAGNDTVYVFLTSVNAVYGGDGDDSIFADWANDDVTLSGGAGNDTIEAWGCSRASILGGKGDDLIYGRGGENLYQYANGDGNDVIYDFCGTLQVTGATYSTLQSGSDLLVSVGSGSIRIKDVATTDLDIKGTYGGNSETIPAGISVKGAVLTASTAFTDSSINLADYASTVTKINASALSRGVSIVGSSAANSLKGGKGADTIDGDTGNDTLYGGAGNDILYGGAGNDKLLSEAGNDTLYGGVGNDTLTGGAGSDVFVYESGNYLITDYKTGEDKIKIASGSITGASLSGSNVILKIGTGNVTVKGAKDKAITVIDASGKETSNIYPLSTLPAGISVKGAILTALAAFTGNEIDVADYSGVTKVNASALSRGVSIVGTAAANSIKGGKGADTISGGGGNDTVSLGGGADIYVYSGGNDLIQDYTAADKIKLASASITGASLSGNNVVLKTSAGNITVKNSKTKKITVIDSRGNETSQIYPSYLNYNADRTVVTIASGFSGTLKATDYDSTVKKIDASAIAKAININGNTLANTILGSAKVDTIYGGEGNDSIFGAAGADKIFGDAGNDTLAGGTGNDTLTGGIGSDVFVYGSGDSKDVITDYTAGQDKIKITNGEITKTSYSGNNVIFTVGNGSLTVKNGKGKQITVTDSTNKTTTQTYSGAVSGSSAILFVDDNLISSIPALDAILNTEQVDYSEITTPRNSDIDFVPGLSSLTSIFQQSK